jgi:Pyruvate/2-oxoacid:ferredoxin oxidoreductase delta subunit
MKRKIIHIDEELCNGCGECIPNCPEGAIQLIDGKARLISDLFCDGLGACLGACPVDAIAIEEREAEPYDERRVMENIVKQGKNVVKAHLDHLKVHGQTEYLAQAIGYLREKGIEVPGEPKQPVHENHPAHESHAAHGASGCPGSRSMAFSEKRAHAVSEEGTRASELTHWPIQLHLISPMAPHFQGKDLVLSADCVAYALGDFHKDYLKGKTLVIACPKLDEGQETYVEKLRVLIDQAKINTLTVMIMQVPCCSGLLRLAQLAASKASRKVPIQCIVVSLEGEILQREWIAA